MRFLEHDDSDDPILSVVNLVDLFLVIIGILLMVFSQKNVTVIENPGQDTMRILIKNGEELTRYEASAQMGEGQGAKVGVTYQLEDGRMIYVPEEKNHKP